MILTIGLLSTVVGSLSLYIASRVTGKHIATWKIIVIAILAQLLLPFALGMLPSLPLPYSNLVIRLLVWVGLIKFMAQEVSIADAILLGGFAFGISYFFSIAGITNFIKSFV